MKIDVDWKENSTKRGAVWLATAIVGTFMLLIGKDISQLIILATAVAGGMGVALKDNL